MEKIIEKMKVVHIIGIGGSGTSGLAKIFRATGKMVQGSDMRRTTQTEYLENLGIPVFYGHNANNIDEKIDLVIRSQAITPDNPEFLRAKELKIPVINYPRALGLLMHEKRGIAVAGTHGKTTTSAMTVFMLKHAGYDPDFVIGGEICGYGNSGVGTGNFLVVEACEYKRSFLNFEPDVGIITSIEEDHLDYYRDINDIKNAFDDFSERIKPGGKLIGMMEDPLVASVMTKSGTISLGYGFEYGDVLAKNIRFTEEGNRFECYYSGKKLGEVFTPVYGKHNVLNVLAVICTGMVLDVPFSQIVDALDKFPGVLRRSQILACVNDIFIVDDYGHHPSELQATLSAARSNSNKRVIAVFQPHRYTRTKLLFDDFGKSFNDADIVIITDIYAASEQKIEGVTSELIINSLKKYGKENVIYFDEFSKIVDYLLETAQSGDIILTLGAGDIWKVSEELSKKLIKKFAERK